MPAPQSETESVEHQIRVEAPQEIVFAHFTDPARMVRWMGTDATLDPRPGGACRLTMANGAVISGKFVEVEPYSRVVFTWGLEVEPFAIPPGSTRVEVSLLREDGATVVRILHRELPAYGVEFHSVGWQHYAARLKLAAEGTELGRDDWVAPRELWPLPPGRPA